jgi:hypothetical protein
MGLQYHNNTKNRYRFSILQQYQILILVTIIILYQELILILNVIMVKILRACSNTKELSSFERITYNQNWKHYIKKITRFTITFCKK